jgi:hypothetical protein
MTLRRHILHPAILLPKTTNPQHREGRLDGIPGIQANPMQGGEAAEHNSGVIVLDGEFRRLRLIIDGRLDGEDARSIVLSRE